MPAGPQLGQFNWHFGRGYREFNERGSVIFGKMNDFRGITACLYKTFDVDTLVYEAYLNMAQLAYINGHLDTARVYRDKTLKLVPWYKTRTDSIFPNLR